jgi:hypothetical protein
MDPSTLSHIRKWDVLATADISGIKREYLKNKINELAANTKDKILEICVGE